MEFDFALKCYFIKKFSVLFLIGIITSSQSIEKKSANVITSNIDNFWNAYDLIVQEEDSIKQIKLIDSLYVQKGSIRP